MILKQQLHNNELIIRKHNYYLIQIGQNQNILGSIINVLIVFICS